MQARSVRPMPEILESLEPATASDCDRAEFFLQSGFWGAFKSEFGWRPRHFIMRPRDLPATPLLVLQRGLGGGFGFAYVPQGPAIEAPCAARASLAAELGRALKQRLDRRCLFIRLDPPWHADGPEPARPGLLPPLRRAGSDVQPPDTVLLDLRPDEDQLLAAMKPKWRYNIRLAEKKGVEVLEARAAAASKDLGDFYELYRQTAARDKIALHPRRYYERLFSLAAEYPISEEGLRPEFRLWKAVHEGELLAAIITLFRGNKAIYLYGASSDSKRNLMPAYALQWAAIRAARAWGCLEYDFFGIAPSDSPDHPMAGLYRFKTGFGGTIIHRAGSWDYPVRPALYSAFRAAESARTWYFKDFRKRGRAGGQGRSSE